MSLLLSDTESSCVALNSDMLERAAALITPNTRAAALFADTLRHPPKTLSGTIERGDIIRDLAAHPELLAALSSHLGSAEAIKGEFDAERKSHRAYLAAPRDSRRTDECISHTKSYSLLALRLFAVLKETTDAIQSTMPSSHGLRRIAERAQELYAAFEEIRGTVRDLADFSRENHTLELSARLNEVGRLERMTLVGIGSSGERPTFKRHGLFKKEKITEPPQTLSASERDFLLFSVLEEYCLRLEDIISAVCDELSRVRTELAFFSTALDYIELIKASGADICFAEAADGMELCGLYDIELLLKSGRADAVCAHDMILAPECDGALIIGENSGGKTVLWRSVILAMLFARSGLPLPCKSAKLPLFDGIYALMASFTDGIDGNGAFEAEVKALAEIVESAPRGSAVFLNEIFQTTAYAEGSAALIDILTLFSRRGIKWMAVTHLDGVKTHFAHCESADVITCEKRGNSYFSSSSIKRPTQKKLKNSVFTPQQTYDIMA